MSASVFGPLTTRSKTVDFKDCAMWGLHCVSYPISYLLRLFRKVEVLYLLLISCDQVIIVPCGITAQLSDDEKKSVLAKCDELVESLQKVGVQVKADLRANYSPGWKFNHWELKVGVWLLAVYSKNYLLFPVEMQSQIITNLVMNTWFNDEYR